MYFKICTSTFEEADQMCTDICSCTDGEDLESTSQQDSTAVPQGSDSGKFIFLNI